MPDSELKLAHAPIVEAVLDIDCDMPPAQDMAALEKPARDCFSGHYPKFQTQHIQQHHFEAKPDAPPKVSITSQGIQAFQFLHDDGKQLVQVRAQGFSFNRLAPYTSLDDYLPEMQRTWRLFAQIASPVAIRFIRLRYINSFQIPLVDGPVELNDYLRNGPQLPDEDKLVLGGFLNQYIALEKETINRAEVILTAQPAQNRMLPIIFDIGVTSPGVADLNNWTEIIDRIYSLRSLKNRIFKKTLTEKCMDLFQR